MAILDNKDVLTTDVKLKSNAPYFSNRSASGKFQKRYLGVQFFELSFNVQFQSEHINQIQRFIALYQHGRVFDFPMSYAGEYKGTAQGIISSVSNNLPGSRQVTLGVFTGTLEAGTLVQFQNHGKLYTVQEDVKSGGTLKLFPALMGQVQAGEQITYRNPKGKFVLTNESFDFDIKSLSQINFKATEKI